MVMRAMWSAVCFALCSLNSQAQQSDGPLLQRNISLKLALTSSQAAIGSCERDGFKVSVAVVDRAGELVVLLRNDQANPHNAELARRKAYTARTFRRPSLEWEHALVATPELSAQRDLAQVIALGGGVPITVGEEVIGAIGVSGATTQEKDDACAKAGVAAIADHLK
jgi:uncharacterized protein GlcG (DUF336 family)